MYGKPGCQTAADALFGFIPTWQSFWEILFPRSWYFNFYTRVINRVWVCFICMSIFYALQGNKLRIKFNRFSDKLNYIKWFKFVLFLSIVHVVHFYAGKKILKIYYGAHYKGTKMCTLNMLNTLKDNITCFD